MEEKTVRTEVARWRDFFEVLFWAFSVALFLRLFFIGVYRVSTSSMAPTLRVGDFVWVSKASYGLSLPFTQSKLWTQWPKRGDLVLFQQPERPGVVHIKRVIGLPGDHVHIRGQQILVNDRLFAQEVEGAESYSDLPGAEFMRFYSESNGEMRYSVMFAQGPGSAAEIGPLVVPPGEIFVVGDNRDASDDSRYWGSIPLVNVEGKMKGIWFSLDRMTSTREPKLMIRWDRIRFDF